MDDWAKVADLTKTMCTAFLQRRVAQESCACTPEAERAADAWIHDWNAMAPDLQMPLDPLVARIVFARFRYAAAASTQYTMFAFPYPKASADEVMATLLFDLWYAHDRARWLSGERGTVPSEN